MVSPCNNGLLSKFPVSWGIACKGEGGFIFLTHLGPFPWSDTKFHHYTLKLVAKFSPLVSRGDTGRGQKGEWYTAQCLTLKQHTLR